MINKLQTVTLLKKLKMISNLAGVRFFKDNIYIIIERKSDRYSRNKEVNEKVEGKTKK